jgi:hypothetical protein
MALHFGTAERAKQFPLLLRNSGIVGGRNVVEEGSVYPQPLRHRVFFAGGVSLATDT